MTYYLETGSVDPAYNLAFEEYVLRYRKEGSYLILWQNKDAVIIGRNQNALEEINRDFVEQQGIKVIRRNTGGGAVFHDLGNLNYSFITDLLPDESITGSRFAQAVVRVLRGLGLDAHASGRNDILIGDQKVSGTAQQRLSGRILYHGTLLFDSDASRIAGALNPDPTKFQSKSVKSVRSRVGNIRSHLQQDMELPAFWQYLKAALAEDGLETVCLSDAELAQIQGLKQEKYDTWQWNFGFGPKFDTHCRRRWSGGLLDIRMCILRGKIESIAIYGDFLAVAPVDVLVQRLIGCNYQEQAIRQALQQLNLQDYLGSITEEEFIATILGQ